MKKLFLSACAVLALASCDIEGAIEDVVNDNIPPIRESTTENFSVPGVVEGSASSQEVAIDISEIQNEIEESSDRSVIIESVSITGLTFEILTADQNFDFVDSLKLEIVLADDSNITLLDLDGASIAEGATSISLPEDGRIDDLESLFANDNQEVNLLFSVDSNTTIIEDLDFQFTTDFEVQVAIDL